MSAREPLAAADGVRRRGAELRPVRPSLLDRLVEATPGAAVSREPTRAESAAAFRQSVRRDLEWLLNTRRQLEEVPEGYEELRRSLVRYGLPDTASLLREAPDTGVRLVRAVEEAIATFEPRLTQVRVTVADDAGGTSAGRPRGETVAVAALRFTIDAVLRVDPVPERVVLETVFDPSRHEYRVRDSEGGADA